MEINLIQQIIIWAIPLVFAITVHEAAHGYVANYFGDPTAKMLGRLSLNPKKHIDPIGTVVVPLFLLVLGGFVFGWARPVPVTERNLRHPKRDMAIVAAAGPAANLTMAIMWAMIGKLAFALYNTTHAGFMFALVAMGSAGITVNLVLFFLNLLPIPPLDGSKVVSAFLTGPASYRYNLLAPYGFMILILLLATGILGDILTPLVGGVRAFVDGLVGIGL